MAGKARKGKAQTRRAEQPETKAHAKPMRRVIARRPRHNSEPEPHHDEEADVSFTGLLDDAEMFAQQAVVSGLGAYPAEAEAAVAFDGAWYLANYPDVKEAGLEPVLHFLAHGVHEGRNPNPHFDGQAYVQANPDIASFPFGPFLHYICFGFREKRPLR